MRMLHVIEGRDSGSASMTALVQSSAGTKYDGGIVGDTIVMFKRTLTDQFSSMTYAASGAKKHYVAGLAPNRMYSISAPGASASATTDSSGLLIFTASGTGNVTISEAVR
jgi:hypothetical protein